MPACVRRSRNALAPDPTRLNMSVDAGGDTPIGVEHTWFVVRQIAVQGGVLQAHGDLNLRQGRPTARLPCQDEDVV
jgi:hypothetical protein